MDQPRQTREGSTEPIEAMGFDRVLLRLRQVVSQLENGQLGIEESLRVYEEGIALARRAHQVLDNAEKRVELLVQGSGRNGEPSAAPFDGDDAGDDHGDSERRG